MEHEEVEISVLLESLAMMQDGVNMMVQGNKMIQREHPDLHPDVVSVLNDQIAALRILMRIAVNISGAYEHTTELYNELSSKVDTVLKKSGF